MRFTLFLMRRYYLGRIHKGLISKEEVAKLYSTSVENVEKAIEEYEANKNPFRKVDGERRQGTIQIVISVISTVLVLLTLFEMQADRNAAYLPNVSIDGANLKFIWNENGMIINDMDNFSEEEQSLWDSMDSTYVQGFTVNIDVHNSGVGVAKDVYVDWLYEENVGKFQDTFSGCNDVSIEANKGQLVIDIKDKYTAGLLYENGGILAFDFLTTGVDSSKTLRFPRAYVELYELAYAKNLSHDIPKLRCVISYEDIQGEVYRKIFNIEPKPVNVLMNPEGNGIGFLELGLTEENSEHISYMSRFGDISLGILFGFVIAGVIFSIMIIAIETNRKRMKITKREPSDTTIVKSAISDE